MLPIMATFSFLPTQSPGMASVANAETMPSGPLFKIRNHE
jgi:hypothetical protein